MNNVKSYRTGCYFLSIIMVYIFTSFVIIPMIPSKFRDANLSIIIGQMILFVPMVIYLIYTKGKALKDVPFSSLGVVNIILLILMTYMLMPFISLINAFSLLFTNNAVTTSLSGVSENPFVINVILLAILPAFMEELTFRGFIYGGYRKCGIKKAIIASAVIFGLFHMNLNQFMYAAVMGIILGMVREATGTIRGSMVMHFVFNFNSVIVLKLQSMTPKILSRLESDGVNQDKIEKLRNQIENSSSTTTLKGMSTGYLINLFTGLLVMALIGTSIAVFIFIRIVKRCSKMKIYSNEYDAKAVALDVNDISEKYNQNNNESIINVPTVASFLLCVLMMMATAFG